MSGCRLDELIMRPVPNVRKAVRWNSPWYSIEGEVWFVVLPYLHPLHQGDGPQWRVAATRSTRLRQGQGLTLGRHLRGRT